MNKFENQEAFILASKRVIARVTRAKELDVGNLDSNGLKQLVKTLSLAKAVETEQPINKVKKGQEYYIQTLLDSLNLTTSELIKKEYDSALFELGSESEILATIEALKAA